MAIFPKSIHSGLRLLVFILLIQSGHLFSQSKIDTTNIIYIDLKSGDLCIVCDMEIDKNSGIGFLLQGRRITIDLEHVHEFFNNPEKYFYKMQAKVALYDERAIISDQINPDWFLFGLWIVIALICAAICANIAMRKGLNSQSWFYYGFVFNLFGLIYLTTLVNKSTHILPKRLGKINLTDAPLKCNACDQYNHPSANECSYCGNGLQSISESELDKV
jgi:hypothetical protein